MAEVSLIHCKGVSVEPKAAQFTAMLNTVTNAPFSLATSPVCTTGRLFSRRSPGDSTRNPESHQDTGPNPGETIEGALIAARSPAIDPIVFHLLVSQVYYILEKFFIHGVNPNFGYLEGVDLAMAQALVLALSSTWGNVTIGEWSQRLHYIIQANTAIDPLDPLAEVEAMICEGSSTKTITDGILLLSKTACTTNTCGVTPSTCSPHSARGNLGDGASIDKDERDNGGSGLLRRAFEMV